MMYAYSAEVVREARLHERAGVLIERLSGRAQYLVDAW
jgi:hypothetical protein